MQENETGNQPGQMTMSQPPRPNPTKTDIAKAMGMPVEALMGSRLKMSDLVGTPRYEIKRER